MILFTFPFQTKAPRSVLTSLVWRSVFPLNLTWTSLILWPLFPVTVAYPVPSHSTFQTSHTIPFLTHFQRKLREMFLRWEVGLLLNPQAGRLLFLRYPWMLIQCIRGHLPYPEVVSSIRNIHTRHAVRIRHTLHGQCMSSHVISLTHSSIFSPCMWPNGLLPLHFYTKISYVFLKSAIRVTTLCSQFSSALSCNIRRE